MEETDHGEEKGIGHFIEPLVIIFILILNAAVGVLMVRRFLGTPAPRARGRRLTPARPPIPQESNAENALEALKEMQSEHAKCWRAGHLVRATSERAAPSPAFRSRRPARRGAVPRRADADSSKRPPDFGASCARACAGRRGGATRWGQGARAARQPPRHPVPGGAHFYFPHYPVSAPSRAPRAAPQMPADMRLVRLKTATLRVEQASLTGESVAVMKRLEPINDLNCELQVRRLSANTAPLAPKPPAPASLPPLPSLDAPGSAVQSKECMMFAGTTISNGQAIGIVTDIGMATEIGRAPTLPEPQHRLRAETEWRRALHAALGLRAPGARVCRKIQEQISAAKEEEEDTPLKKKLDEFGP